MRTVDVRPLRDGLQVTSVSAPRGFGGVPLRWARVLPLIALGVASVGCAPEDGAIDTRAGAVSIDNPSGARQLDLLFVIDDASGMAEMQSKLYDQIPNFLGVLMSLPTPPDLHVAVISSDMGVPGSDQAASIGCTLTGDQGMFQAQPRGACTDSTLAPGATFISVGHGVANYTAASISEVLQCILPLGDEGCRFGLPLASIVRALGADGAPAPAGNAGFLRGNASLAIIILSNEDDCSASSPTTALYSLNNGPDNLINSIGPLAPYRCNEWGHLCLDPHGQDPAKVIQPPETSPQDAQGAPSAPTLDLLDCQSNETGGLMKPVGTFVEEIRALKPSDPDNLIVVSAIVAPASPYTVAWVPAVGAQAAEGELWPQIEHSCGAPGGINPEATQTTTDGSFGDPAVRLTQFVKAFGSNSVVASICDASYASSVQNVATMIGALPLEVTGTAGTTGDGGGSLVDGGGVTGAGASGGKGGVSPGGLPGTGGFGGSGLRDGGCACSVGAAAPGGAGLSALLVALAILRRRTRGTPKNLT
jgi:MYXO-CTERM domain-containing protein